MPTHDSAVRELIGALRGVLAQAAEPNHVLGVILQQAVTLSGASRGVFVEVSAAGELAFRVLHRYRADLLQDPGHFSRSVFAAVLDSRSDLLIANAATDPRLAGSASVHEFRMTSVLCMPIRIGERIAALVHLENGQLGYFQPEHVALLGPLLDIAAPMLEALGAGRAILDERDRLRDEVVESRGLLAREWSFGRFVGRSPAVRDLEERITQAARTDFPVLLLGETGTGKSILARVVHSASARAPQPLITVFCPSLERSLVEAELFGHRRGAFTGAVSDRIGKVQAAHGGTLFLDEIGDLPLEIQPKLLRLLQERVYERVGDPEERRADVRVVAATNRALEVEVREGRFRRDLYERLNYVPVRVPALRERREDIPALLRHALDQSDAGRWVEMAPEALDYLVRLDFEWPGNVRHLEQLAARLSMESSTRQKSVADVRRLLDAPTTPGVAGPREPARPTAAPPVEARDAASAAGDSPLGLEAGLQALVKQAERVWIEEALRRYPRLTRAELASKLRISEATLFKKLRIHGLTS